MAEIKGKASKPRINICMDAGTRRRAQKLQKAKRRSFSGLCEDLIEQEFARLFPKPNAKARAA